MVALPLFLTILSLIQGFFCQDSIFYCSQTSTLKSPVVVSVRNTDSTVRIITRYENEKNYRENMLCTWQIEAPENHRIELFDFQVNLPFAPDYSSCNSYDYLQVANLNNNSILQMCRSNNVKYVFSIGNKLYVKFASNGINHGKGIEFSVRIWDTKTSCPKTWFQTTDGKCLTVYDPFIKLPLEDSQTHCNYVQSNLASFDSQQQLKEFLVNSYSRNLIKSYVHWIGLTDVEKSGQLVWLDDKRVFDFNNVTIRKDGQNGDKNCLALEVPSDNDEKSPSFAFSRMSCTQKTIKLPFICKMNQTGLTKLATIPTEPSLKDVEDSISLIFLKIGFPILAILIAICLVVLVIFAVKLEDKCSKNQVCIARLSTYSIVTILTILFMILFIMGIMTRRMVVMIIGIPILILILATIVFIICIHARKNSTPSNRHTKTASDTELQELNSKTQTRGRGGVELPTYDEAINS